MHGSKVADSNHEHATRTPTCNTNTFKRNWVPQFEAPRLETRNRARWQVCGRSPYEIVVVVVVVVVVAVVSSSSVRCGIGYCTRTRTHAHSLFSTACVCVHCHAPTHTCVMPSSTFFRRLLAQGLCALSPHGQNNSQAPLHLLRTQRGSGAGCLTSASESQ